jgi:LuxR family maltose regulon positive regulatory protein
VRAILTRGRPDAALATLGRLAAAAESAGRRGSLVEIRVLQALAWWEKDDAARALAELERSLALAEPEGYVRTFVDEGPPMHDLLGLARRRGIAPAYVDELLRAFAVPPSLAPRLAPPAPPRRDEPGMSGLLEPLSERERDVLRLLVAGRNGPQIAETLVVAPSTIKTHLKRIYGKLDAHSRDQAIARARELNLT